MAGLYAQAEERTDKIGSISGQGAVAATMQRGGRGGESGRLQKHDVHQDHSSSCNRWITVHCAASKMIIEFPISCAVFAANSGQLDCARMLLDRGACVNAQVCDSLRVNRRDFVVTIFLTRCCLYSKEAASMFLLSPLHFLRKRMLVKKSDVVALSLTLLCRTTRMVRAVFTEQ